MATELSEGALRRADEFLDELIDEECNKRGAPCLRDDLADNRAWLRLHFAALIEEVADGRPLYADER